MRPAPGGSAVALSVVLPVYNETASIEAVLRSLVAQVRARPLEVLVVYDSEEDRTVPVVRRLLDGLPEVRLVRNRLGSGALNAIRAGFATAEAPYVAVMMADGSDEPETLNLMLTVARRGADVVAGSRYMRAGGQLGGPRVKRTLSRLAGVSLHWLGGLPVHDATSNFRLYSRRLLDRVTIESRGGFELALELTVKAHLGGMQVAEVPTTWHDRTAGTSRFRLVKWLPNYLRWYALGLTGRFRRRVAEGAAGPRSGDRAA